MISEEVGRPELCEQIDLITTYVCIMELQDSRIRESGIAREIEKRESNGEDNVSESERF